jgi:DNA-binding NarL/FixJ family response regulator
MSLRVLIADDHPMFRAGLRGSLGADPDLEIVGEAESGTAVVDLALALTPDLVLMDLQMPGGGGIQATATLRERVPGARVLVLTMYEDAGSIFAAMRAGARGYLLKGAGEEDVIRAVRTVAEGGLVIGPAVADLVAGFFASGHQQGPEAFPELTDREREILELIARGMSNPTISHRLMLSEKTVRNYVSSILTKLAVVDRSAAIVLAREAGVGIERPGPR